MSAFDRGVALAFEETGTPTEAGGIHQPVISLPDSPVGGAAKRILDILLSIVGLIALSPLYLFVGLTLAATSAGPVFFGHKRVGFGGREFRCWKFRTMRIDGDAILENHLLNNAAARIEWASTRKLRSDPRVTAFGQVLRTYSVDELPQLWNVLRGDMSLIGPRPVVQEELAEYGAASKHYLAARSGITGLWQISGRSDASYDDRVAFDVTYASDWSFVRDLRILLQTVPAVLFARGSY